MPYKTQSELSSRDLDRLFCVSSELSRYEEQLMKFSSKRSLDEVRIAIQRLCDESLEWYPLPAEPTPWNKSLKWKPLTYDPINPIRPITE